MRSPSRWNLLALNRAHVTGRARGCAEALPRDFGLGVRLGFPPHKLPGGEKQRVPIARARERSGGDPRRRADGQPRLEDRREIARLHLRIATEEARGVVIVGHDARLTDVADRVLWLEDGAFRSISDMATDPLCGIAVGRQRTPHVVHDGTTWYFCSPECREEFVRYPMRFLAIMATAREEHAERRWGTCRTPS